MKTATIGHTDMQISSLGLGSAPFGNSVSPVSEAQAVATIEAALAHGITMFDTAPLYGAGLAEQFLGVALAGVPRDSYVLSTKVGRLVQDDGTVVFDMSRDGILRSLDESLTRLKLDRVDILLLHDPDDFRSEAFDVVLPLLTELRAQGVVRAIGTGMNQWQMPAEFIRQFEIDCLLLAGRYTLLEQGALSFLALCQERNVGVFLGGVYNSGILATGPIPGAQYNYAPATQPILDRVQQIEQICKRYEVPLRVAATRFAAGHPAVTALVFGAISPAEVAENIAASELVIPTELWTDLQAAGLLDKAAPLPA